MTCGGINLGSNSKNTKTSACGLRRSVHIVEQQLVPFMHKHAPFFLNPLLMMLTIVITNAGNKFL